MPIYKVFARCGTYLYTPDFAPLLGFLLVQHIEKNKTCCCFGLTLYQDLKSGGFSAFMNVLHVLGAMKCFQSLHASKVLQR